MDVAEDDVTQFERAVSGDVAVLRTLLERYGQQVWNEIHAQIGRQWQTALDADDVMQVTYVEAFPQIGMLQARDGAGFLAWLRRIAENNLRDAIKELDAKKRPSPAQRIRPPDGDESYVALIETLGVESATPSRDAASSEARGIVHSALDQLPPDYSKVVRLYDLQGRAIGEVARELGRSPAAVHMLRARAHDHLRAMLGSETRFFSGPQRAGQS
jgi:RNA polymerase sigma factor (sigma-70 family)